MLIYNIHAPSKTFAVQSKEDETYDGLIDRITKKAGLEKKDATALKTGKEGALVYEFEGERWSLEDDDDLSILHSRLPPKSSPSATLHLSPPHAHAHFAPSPAPPAYSTASSAIKSKNQNRSRTASATKSNTTANGSSSTTPKSPKSKDFATQTPSSNGDEAKHPSKSSPQKPSESEDKSANPVAKYEREVGKTATGFAVARPKSVMSARTNRTHRSKWGDDDAEPMGDVHKRKWLEFHANNGVRTVVGKVGDVEGVRILLKSGYKGVYISRPFAIKAGLVDKKFGMGTFGYTGLKTIGNVPIKIGSKTALHSALVNEEQHFDVVLGRTWLEKMNVKVDPLDQTILTYMDNGESIACDIVVLKDADGNVITIT